MPRHLKCKEKTRSCGGPTASGFDAAVQVPWQTRRALVKSFLASEKILLVFQYTLRFFLSQKEFYLVQNPRANRGHALGQEEQKIIPVPVLRVIDLCGALHYFANDHSGLFSSCSSYRKQAREISQLLFDGYIRQSGIEAYRPGKVGLQTMVTTLIS